MDHFILSKPVRQQNLYVWYLCYIFILLLKQNEMYVQNKLSIFPENMLKPILRHGLIIIIKLLTVIIDDKFCTNVKSVINHLSLILELKKKKKSICKR